MYSARSIGKGHRSLQCGFVEASQSITEGSANGNPILTKQWPLFSTTKVSATRSALRAGRDDGLFTILSGYVEKSSGRPDDDVS
jgi:hypothetical protein